MSSDAPAPGDAEKRTVYRCGPAARWMPRALGAGVLVGSMLAAFRLDAARELSFGAPLQGGVVVVGAFVALGILRAGGETRLRLHFDGGRLYFSAGSHSSSLALDSAERFDREAPFGPARKLFPAVLIIDRGGRPWRLPVMLEPGEKLLREIVERTNRSDLGAWVESLHLDAWMRRGKTVVAAGYALAVAIAAAGWLFYVR